MGILFGVLAELQAISLVHLVFGRAFQAESGIVRLDLDAQETEVGIVVGKDQYRSSPCVRARGI